MNTILDNKKEIDYGFTDIRIIDIKDVPDGWSIEQWMLCSNAKQRIGTGLPESENIKTELQDLSLAEVLEIHRMQLAAISTAAFGYYKEGESIHPDYNTPTLRDICKLYQKYDELYKFKQSILYKLYKFFN